MKIMYKPITNLYKLEVPFMEIMYYLKVMVMIIVLYMNILRELNLI